MTKYILHGGFSRKDNSSNRAFFKEIGKDVPDGGTVLLVYFASESDDPVDTERRFEQHSQLITEESGGKKLHYILATKEDFAEQVQVADAIFLNGGSTDKLLEALRAYPDLRALFDGKTVAGSSAGAYSLASYGTSHSHSNGYTGLGHVNVRLVCHFESEELPPNRESLEKLSQIAPELSLVTLRDFEWKVFNAR